MYTPLDHPPLADLPPIPPLRFPTLLAVELRKMIDTRSGRGLLAGTVGATVAVLVWEIATRRSSRRTTTTAPASPRWWRSCIRPPIGLLAMTSEWTQRTALTTFTLAPRRLDVLMAKYVASFGARVGEHRHRSCARRGRVRTGGCAARPGRHVRLARRRPLRVDLPSCSRSRWGPHSEHSRPNTPLAEPQCVPVGPDRVDDAGRQRAALRWRRGSTLSDAYGRLSSDHPLDGGAKTLTAASVWVVAPAVVGLVLSLRREVK